MSYEAKLIGTLKDGRGVWQVAAPLNEQISTFRQVGIRHPFLASPDKVAQPRIDGVSDDFSRTSYAPVKVRGEPTILTADSVLMNEAMAKFAVKSYRRGEYFTQRKDYYEVLKEIAKRQEGLEPEDRDTHILEGKPDANGVVSLSSDMPDARFLIKKFTEEYFKRYSHSIIPLYDLIDKDIPKGQAVVNYLWFGNPQNGSLLNCRNRNLYYDDMAFGVRDVSAEGAAQKNLGYSITEIRNVVRKSMPQVLKDVGVPALTDMVSGPLEVCVLETLRKSK